MSEQSHRDEMSAAIRAQRERRAAPRSIAPEPKAAGSDPEPDSPAEKQPEPERKTLLGRLRGK